METTTALSVTHIARVCHEANKAYCESIGDTSQKSWEQAEQWQRDSAIKGVQFRLNNPDAPQSAQHDSWMADKLAEGWTYGPEKMPESKIHNCLVPYDQLPEEQRRKDALFQAVVDSLTKTSNGTVTITADHYIELKKDQAWLRSLEGAGVDNWDGYDIAGDSFRENYPEYNQKN